MYGTPYRPVRRDALTCSSACRQKAYRRRLSVTNGVTGNVHFSSRTDLWETPQNLFDELNREFHFTLDVCALPGNAKCAAFYSPADDGLAQCWTGVCWMNPPYGRAIGLWVAKAYAAGQDGATVVALVPARTDTKWWQDYLTKGADIRFLRGRLRFSGAKVNAPFPNAVVVFKNGFSEPQEKDLEPTSNAASNDLELIG
jgi:phage N-6-adenine-methyltransferase